MIMIGNECFNCMRMVSCKVTTIENQKGYRGHQGPLEGLLGAILGALGGVRVYWGWQGL